MGKNVSKSSLARANQDRNYRIFEEYAFDSTTIDLCLVVFWWAKFRKKKGGIKVHTLYDVETQIPTFFHITTASTHDSKATKDYPKQLRLVRFFDEEKGREFAFLTNATHISSSLFAELYKNRWQIELFFKWLKQHLKIKKFWGITENAVRIQIYVAICTYLLVTIVKNDMKLEISTYEVLQILSISLTDKTHLKDLFDKTKFQYDKDRFGPNEPNLFNV